MTLWQKPRAPQRRSSSVRRSAADVAAEAKFRRNIDKIFPPRRPSPVSPQKTVNASPRSIDDEIAELAKSQRDLTAKADAIAAGIAAAELGIAIVEARGAVLH
jgi:hypothetical protein